VRCWPVCRCRCSTAARSAPRCACSRRRLTRRAPVPGHGADRPEGGRRRAGRAPGPCAPGQSAGAADAAGNAALLARQRYSSGLVDFQTVLDTQRTQLNAQDSVASAVADGQRRPRAPVQGAGRWLASDALATRPPITSQAPPHDHPPKDDARAMPHRRQHAAGTVASPRPPVGGRHRHLAR
jgi:hypothetical protein